MADEETETLQVEVAWATSGEQVVITIPVPGGTTVGEAIALSGITQRCRGLQSPPIAIGIYGKAVAPDTVLRHGDRIEMYRPLVADPKQARRRRAAERR
jgi:putative ubiquitin-RnfH superfamily antitoxin RatB of RatAB toxin-antitoxin module